MKYKPEIKKAKRDQIIRHMYCRNSFWSAARDSGIRLRTLRRYCKLHKDFYNLLKRLRAGEKK